MDVNGTGGPTRGEDRRTRAAARSGLLVVGAAIALVISSCATSAPTMVPDPTAADLERGAHGPSIGTVVTESYGPDPMHVVQYVVPEGGATSEAMILFVHGGGWAAGDRTGVSSQLLRQTSRGYVFATIEYRLTPPARFPDNLTDVKRAVRWAKANAARLGVRPDRIVLAGYSAGSHLALLAGETVGQYEPTDLPPDQAAVDSRPAGIYAGVGPTDLSALMTDAQGNERDWAHDLVGKLLGCQSDTGAYDGALCPDLVREASPVQHIASGQPDLYLVYGGLDETVDAGQQGLPFANPYASSGGRVWYDFVQDHEHDAPEHLNATALDAFLDQVTHTSPPPYPTTSTSSSSTTSSDPAPPSGAGMTGPSSAPRSSSGSGPFTPPRPGL